MKKALLLLMVLVLASAAFAQAPNWFKGTLDEAIAKAKVDHKLVLVDFYSYTWGSCKLLGQQFYDNPKFAAFLDKNFVLFRAISQEPAGKLVFDKFGIRATPTTMVIGGDAAEVDWSVGYGPPAENFQASLQKMVDGVDTFKAVSAAYAKNPKDAAVAFKLARKYGDRYDTKKSIEKYKEVLALDPQGKAGTFTQEYSKTTAPYVEFAALAVATNTEPGQKQDMAPIKAFIAKYPKSPLVKQAYGNMGFYYGYQATKEEAAPFFAEYAAKYPADPEILNQWLTRINKDKGPYEKGVELADKLRELTRSNPEPNINQTIAQLYILKGDKAKADEVFGKSFMEGQVSSMAYNLIAYANFWMENGGDKENAVAMAETALKLEPDNSYFLGQVAGLYVKNGQDAKALLLYGPAFSRKNITDATALYVYAGFWARQGKNLDDALVAAKKAVELMPTTYYLYSTLSTVYDKMKNKAEAVKALEKAVELAPDAAKETFKKNLEKLKNPTPEKK